IVFCSKQSLLGLQHRDEVHRTLTQPRFRKPERFARTVNDDLLQALALERVGNGDEGDLHVAECGKDCLAIGLHQYELAALRELQLSLEPEAIEQRLGDVQRDAVKGALRREQQFEYVALIAALTGQRNAWEERGTGRLDAGVGRGKAPLGTGKARALEQKLRRA